MGHADGGIFISGSCETGYDYNGSAESYMGKVLLEKGFDAYMAPKGSVFTIYSDSIVGAVSTNLCAVNQNDPYGRRQTLGEALDNAEAEWGDHDIYGISFEIYGDRDVRLLPTWEEAYEKVILTEAPDYGSIVQLVDLDFDYTPELLLGSRPGSGVFSMIEGIWTFRDDRVQKVTIPDMDHYFLSLNGYTPYKNKYTGQHRIEGTYTLRAGAGNYSTCISVYNLFNKQASMETVFVEEQTYNMLKNTENHYYYQGTERLQSKSAYDKAVKDWRSEWQKISKHAFASEYFNSSPAKDKIREMMKTYNKN